MTTSFAFGIESLDGLFGDAKSRSMPITPTTACIVGPDGCGKSLLAMHAASEYAAWTTGSNDPSTVTYVSTDLSFEQAFNAWHNFGLGFPIERKKRLVSAYDDFSPISRQFNGKETAIGLTQVSPAILKTEDQRQPLEKLFRGGTGEVFFLDLHRESAGDDWTFLNHLVGLLSSQAGGKPHLLVVDAIEGLEAFVGRRDAFGERRTRRSRIAQLVRSCTLANCHVFFVVEESSTGDRTPEQFVADIVLRLRTEDAGSYLQRSLEIEKCRGGAHTRGRHEFYIRGGEQTQTGDVVNYDHPEVPWPVMNTDMTEIKDGTLAHFLVIPSLHQWNSILRRDTQMLPVACGCPTFGKNLHAINEDLASVRDESADTLNRRQTEYVHNGSLTYVLGDAGTNKSRLGRAFLAQGFAEDAEECVSVLLSSHFIDRTDLLERLNRHVQVPLDPERVLCRRLSVRYMSSAQFLHIVETYIRRAQHLVFKAPHGEVPESSVVRARRSSQIRIVIDDWNDLLDMHPNMDSNPLLLPSLVALLKREGVNAIVVSTQPGQPSLSTSELKRHDLRKQNERQILTWTVMFYGQRRVAVTTQMPASEGRFPEIYELRSRRLSNDGQPEKYCNESVHADRHFALYDGLDSNQLRRVPLEVRLYVGAHTEGDREPDATKSFPRAIQDTFVQIVPPVGSNVVRFEPYSAYDEFFYFADWLDDSRLEHTVVFQVDEFWSDRKRSLLHLNDYADEIVAYSADSEIGNGEELDSDMHRVFQPHEACKLSPAGNVVPLITDEYRNESQFSRRHMWIGESDGGPPKAGSEQLIDRIPYVWDFGHILARKDLWQRCREHTIYPEWGDDNREAGLSIGQVWNCLAANKTDQFQIDSPPDDSPSLTSVRWTHFFDSCRIVAKETGVIPFDVDLDTAETISALVLEVWASITMERFRNVTTKNRFQDLTDRNNEPRTSLRSLLQEHTETLFLACEQVVGICQHIRSIRRALSRKLPDRQDFAASREWYSTSSAIMRKRADHAFHLLRLPGHFSTRGDWFLAIARGSRSSLLGQKALDLLSSRRMNLLRLADGIGLPVRDIMCDSRIGDLQTAMTRVDPASRTSKAVTYREVCNIGATVDTRQNATMNWLWRSQLRHYDRDSFYWRRWICRLFAERRDFLPEDYAELGRQDDRQRQIVACEDSDLRMPLESCAKQYRQFVKKVDILSSALRG